MPPKAGESEERTASKEPEDEIVEPVEEVIQKKCFRIGGQVYYGECKKNGQVYLDGEGESEDFIRHGYGKQVFSAVTVTGEMAILSEYEGYWEEDVISKHGTYKWADGSSYEGSFENGQMHGYGRYQWPEGSSYTGMWANNQMSGQGRFDSEFDGDFLQGVFWRNCFQQHDGKHLDIHREHRKAERLRIAEGEPRGVNITRCTSKEAFEQGLTDILAENLIPLVVADESFPGDPLSWIAPCDETTTVSLDQVALAKRRQNDYRRVFYEAIKESLKTYKWLTIVYDAVSEENPQTGTDDNEGSGSLTLPDEWRLEHFFEQNCLPLEVFDLKIFNGRRMSQFYLPEEKKVEQRGDDQGYDMDGQSGDGPSGGAEDEDQPTIVHKLRLMLVTLGRIAADMSDSEVRAGIIARYGAHLPLHRTQILLLSEAVGDDGFDATQRLY